MNSKLLEAVQKAQEHVENFTKPVQDGEEGLRIELNKLTKAQLINKIVEESHPKTGKVKIEDVVYAILEDPDCAWLTWDMIATIITNGIPEAKTTGQSLRWYPSEGTKKGKNIIPRKKTSEIAALMAEMIK